MMTFGLRVTLAVGPDQFLVDVHDVAADHRQGLDGVGVLLDRADHLADFLKRFDRLGVGLVTLDQLAQRLGLSITSNGVSEPRLRLPIIRRTSKRKR